MRSFAPILLSLLLPVPLASAQEEGSPILAGAAVSSAKAAEPLLWTPQTLTGDLAPALAGLKPLGRLLRLHVVAADAAAAEEAWRLLAATFPPGASGPAITVVQTALPGEARFGVDATLVPAAGVQSPDGSRVLAPGSRLFISGQAERGDGTLAGATRATLESLKASLAHAGGGLNDVAQVKTFLSPMAGAEAVRAEVAKFFPGEPPPLVFTEWTSPLIEIEWVANIPDDATDAPVVEHLTPPGVKPSPVFSRMARVNGGDLHFVAGIYGKAGEAPGEEVRGVLETLRVRAGTVGSDLRHLAKATYYVSSDGTSKSLNDLRPGYYDPARPPAASKSPVTGVGLPGRAIVVDMIAVSPSTEAR